VEAIKGNPAGIDFYCQTVSKNDLHIKRMEFVFGMVSIRRCIDVLAGAGRTKYFN